MKRGGALKRHVRLARVSAKVRRARPEFARVYHEVDVRSGGRCEVRYSCEVSLWEAEGIERRAVPMPWRCPARAIEHHHTRKPRRANHLPALIVHLCRRHHARTTAAYRTGRLLIAPAGDGTFGCQVVQKAGKWAPP